MAQNTERVTAYLTDGERAALRLLARHLGTSENGVIKVLIRDRVGFSIPEQYQHQLDTLDELLTKPWTGSHEIYR